MRKNREHSLHRHHTLKRAHLCCERKCPPTSTTLSEYCNCGTVAVLSTLNHPGICRCTQLACERQCPASTAATVGSRPISPAQQGRRTPDQWNATGESQWSAELDQGKRPLRHDRVVDDLDMHNGLVNTSPKKHSLTLCVPVSEA